MANEEIGQAADQRLIDAFNAGYTMQKYEPELLDKILKSDNAKSEYMQALAQGRQQHERERIIQQQQQIREKKQEKRPRR
jgi:predicted RNA polymerase sigma factor